MNRLLPAAAAAAIFLACPAPECRAQGTPATFLVASPDGRMTVSVSAGADLTYAVSVGDRQIVRPSPISMTLADGRVLGRPAVVASSATRSVDQVLKPVVPAKRAEIRDRYNERRIDFTGGYALVVRVFDDGMAYRFATRLPGDIVVKDEEATFRFGGDYLVHFPEETSLLSHQERLYLKLRLSDIAPPRFSGLPVLVSAPDGPRIAVTEADLLDYPGMDVTSDSAEVSLRGSFPAYPKKVELVKDRDEAVVEREPFIARTKGTREFPWRVLAVVSDDRGLIDTDIVYRLASENAIGDTSWIRPGKVAWDWWNANNVYGVPFKSGVNTETYKHYIDFAAKHHLEYVILDEGWYPLGDLLSVSPAIDMRALTAYATEKKVGLVLWVVWKTLDGQMQAALDRFAAWDIKGIKVDFMQREDQWMVNFYERVAREAARRHLLVDFHGAYKPTGLSRTFPNVLTSEGVKGLEQSKWSTDASPDHAVTWPFIRMLAGPADYTPGAMINAAKGDFRPVFDRPMSQGTRCQQLAMYVVYESPLQMLADSPSNYEREPDAMAFLEAVPTVWDETRVLDGKVGEYVLVARRRGREWFVGAMTGWTPRELKLNLSFLGDGRFTADVYRDGANADRVGVDYVRASQPVASTDTLAIRLAPGGGWVARIR